MMTVPFNAASGGRSRRRSTWIGALLLFVLGTSPLLGPSLQAADLGVSVLHSFGLAAPGGAQPFSKLASGNDGFYYGTTVAGGANNAGTVYRLSPDGAFRTLYDFGSSADDGQAPQGGLVLGTDGNLYGVTSAGGRHGDGTIFRTTPGGSVSVIYHFGDFASDGSAPNEPVLASDGNLYGTTFGGGANARGTVYRIAGNGAAPPASPTILSFGATDGLQPTAALVQGLDGNLYGTTSGGGTGQKGTVFRVTLGGALTTLHAFAGTDGSDPEAPLLLAQDGKFYGTTQFGGNVNRGVIYTLTHAGVFAIVHHFQDRPADGAFPRSGLVATVGQLIGTTQGGGAFGLGAAYALDTSGNVTLLHSFGDGTQTGVTPAASPVVTADGNYLGVTLNGGDNGTGLAYRIAPDNTFTVLHHFDASAPLDGSGPAAPLAAGVDGTLYGTTQLGGAGGVGTLFAVSPGGALTTLHSFDADLSDGANPAAALTITPDGSLYGVTPNGGAFTAGTLFRFSPAGAFSVLKNFGSNSTDGSSPQAGMVLGANGNLYGTTLAGGTQGRGTVFTCNLAGACTSLHDFGATATDGGSPVARLVLVGDTLYGTTLGGGTADRGTIFSLSAAGVYSQVHSFGVDATAGRTPSSSLALAVDGSLLGATREGGANGQGTVYRLVPGAGVTTLYAFGATADDGRKPDTDLVRGSDGAFYGVTNLGGTRDAGIAFRITTDGSYQRVHDFGVLAADARYPFAGLTTIADGTLYGTTSRGGVNGTGTVFRLGVTPASPGGDSDSGGGGGGGSLSPALLCVLMLAAFLRRGLLGSSTARRPEYPLLAAP